MTTQNEIKKTTINVAPKRLPQKQDVVYFIDHLGRKVYDLILDIDKSRSFIIGQNQGDKLSDKELHIVTAEFTY